VDISLLEDLGLTEADAKSCLDLAEKITVPTLSRIWQILIKGAEEMQYAPISLQALQMVILRLVYASQLPALEDISKAALNGEISSSPSEAPIVQVVERPAESAEPIENFEALLDLFAKNKEPLLYAYLKADVNLVSFEPGKVEIKLNEQVPRDLPLKVSKYLR